MAQFAKLRRRLARFRGLLERVLVGEAVVLGGLMFVMWLLTGEAISLLMTTVMSVGPFISIGALRRDIRPHEDLRGTVQRLNSKKKFYRKRFGIRARFSAKWFPFPEFAPISDVQREKAP